MRARSVRAHPCASCGRPNAVELATSKCPICLDSCLRKMVRNCDRKVRYRFLENAQCAVDDLLANLGDVTYPYFCTICKGYHHGKEAMPKFDSTPEEIQEQIERLEAEA